MAIDNHLILIARSYARAAYEHAKEHNNVLNWSKMLLYIARCVKQDQVSLLLKNPTYPQMRTALLILNVLNGALDKPCENFVRILAKNNRLTCIPSIYQLFLTNKNKDNKVKEVKITMAFEYPVSLIQKLKIKLEKKYNCSVTLKRVIDSSLIGGFIVNVDDNLIDGSIKGSLERLQCELQK